MAYRKERAHQYGSSNRAKDWKPAEQTGPLNFDQNMRSTAPQLYRYTQDLQVPANLQTGSGNQDFHPKLPGHDYRMPNAYPLATQRMKKEKKAAESAAELERTANQPVKIIAPTRQPLEDEKVRQARQKGHKVAPRWNANKWFEPPVELRGPLQKDEGETWNHNESKQTQGQRKGQDRLMRSVRGGEEEDAETPRDESAGSKHPLGHDHEEYYPGRGLLDAVGDQPGNDFQVRPVHLPDFANPPPENSDPIQRMQRIREVIKQRYAGRPGLIRIFRSCAITKPGFVFPSDLQQIFDQMGIKVSAKECEMLVKAVDKDYKGALSYEEFSDMIYGSRVSVGGAAHESQERHVRHVTKTLVDSLVANGQKLGKAFCEVDPERRYVVSKDQFRNALSSACNHISNQALEFLWAAQFPGQDGSDIDSRCVDWRSFMSQVAHFAHDHRAPTPCCVQGRKRQYDLLQRSAPLTGGVLTDLDLNRPAQNANDEVHIVGDQLVHRHNDLPNLPRQAAFLTPHYVEDLRVRAQRVEQALPERIPKARLRELLRNRERVHQDELIDMLATELDDPGLMSPLEKKDPLYKAMLPSKVGQAEVMDFDSAEKARDPAGRTGAIPKEDRVHGDANVGSGGQGNPPRLNVVKSELQAYVSTLRHDKDNQVDVESLLEEVYRPLHEKKQLEYVNDGLNRQLRKLRPLRERPSNDEHPRYENYWQARYMMDNLNDAMAQVENSNGGQIKPSRVFKRLDMDGDGYITMTDLKAACERFNIPHNNADLHAMFSAIDVNDQGSVDIGDFTRNYEVASGNIMESMMKPIRAVYHEGGVEYGGPVQEALDARDKAILEGQNPTGGAAAASAEQRSRSEPPNSGGSGRSRASGSQISRAGASIAGGVPMIYAPEGSMAGKGRISDVIRSRTSQWKAHKAELHTSVPKTRFGMTHFPDTRHITEAFMPHSGSYLADVDRFKTTNSVKSIFAVPEAMDPQQQDAIRKHARNEFRVERIRARQSEFIDRSNAANEAAREFDELKIARKAMNQLNYERRVQMSCG